MKSNRDCERSSIIFIDEEFVVNCTECVRYAFGVTKISGE
jgi:ribosomal protein S27E